MSISLAMIRNRTLNALDETGIDNSSWYHSAATPYQIIDQYVNQAEIDLGLDLLMAGCKDALAVKSANVTFPASTEDVAWSSLDTSGGLPGSKVMLIEDTTSDLPMYIRMESFSRKDRWDPANIYESPRYRELRNNISDTVAILYKDKISIYPKFSSARTLVIYYVPEFGKMTGIGSVTVTAGGSGFTAATVTISDTYGSGATATGTVAGGAVTSIAVVNPGRDYTAPTVTITGGSSATATASVGVNSKLPDVALQAFTYRAADMLLRLKGRDNTQMQQSYQEALRTLINALQTDRALTWRRRPRYKGPIV